jgi:hypothetical protein
MPELHPDVAALAPLLGTWTGAGRGEYPTIEPFGYYEEITFGHVGKPFLTYTQKTRSDDGTGAPGRPLHAEMGYLRSPKPGWAELVLAHPTGITEIEEGSLRIDGPALEIDLISTNIGLTDSAKEVMSVARWIRLDGDELTYRLRMAAVGHQLRHHLAATLHRNTP